MKDLADGLRLAGLDFGLLGDGDVGELIWIASAIFRGPRGVPPTWDNIYRGDIAARRVYKAVAAYDSAAVWRLLCSPWRWSVARARCVEPSAVCNYRWPRLLGIAVFP